MSFLLVCTPKIWTLMSTYPHNEVWNHNSVVQSKNVWLLVVFTLKKGFQSYALRRKKESDELLLFLGF